MLMIFQYQGRGVRYCSFQLNWKNSDPDLPEVANARERVIDIPRQELISY